MKELLRRLRQISGQNHTCRKRMPRNIKFGITDQLPIVHSSIDKQRSWKLKEGCKYRHWTELQKKKALQLLCGKSACSDCISSRAASVCVRKVLTRPCMVVSNPGILKARQALMSSLAQTKVISTKTQTSKCNHIVVEYICTVRIS